MSNAHHRQLRRAKLIRELATLQRIRDSLYEGQWLHSSHARRYREIVRLLALSLCPLWLIKKS
jgi:hypothetical protein